VAYTGVVIVKRPAPTEGGAKEKNRPRAWGLVARDLIDGFEEARRFRKTNVLSNSWEEGFHKVCGKKKFGEKRR